MNSTLVDMNDERPAPHPRAEIWRTRVDWNEIETYGRKWPMIQILKFEENLIGERRYVGSQLLEADEDGIYRASSE